MNRFFDSLPAIFSWGTLFLLAFLSWQTPWIVAVFIVLYDLYWLLRLLYLYIHLRHSFVAMRRNEKVQWSARLQMEKLPWEQVRHLVIFPMYHEPYEVVRESVASIQKSSYEQKNIWMVIATEERGGEADQEVARRVEEEFKDQFAGFLVTIHPQNIPGELPGKGSNETWAVKEAVQELIEPSGVRYEDVLVSVLDIDTRVGEEYFGILTYKFLTAEHPLRSSFQPIPIFTNNLDQVPVFARIVGMSCTFWQLMQQSRKEQLATFSSHSIPLAPLVEMGYWNTDIVSEDSRIFFQGLTFFDGDWRTVPLQYPVHMDAVGGTTLWEALKNLYRQQRRWAWGVENIPYTLKAFRKNKTISLWKKTFWTYILFEGFYSWATSSFIIFLFGWFPNLFGGFAFRSSLLSYNMTDITGILINISTLGIVTSAFFSVFLIPRTTKTNPFVYYSLAILQWFLTPITILFFGSIPALESQTRLLLGGKFRLGFWKTPKDRKE